MEKRFMSKEDPGKNVKYDLKTISKSKEFLLWNTRSGKPSTLFKSENFIGETSDEGFTAKILLPDSRSLVLFKKVRKSGALNTVDSGLDVGADNKYADERGHQTLSYGPVSVQTNVLRFRVTSVFAVFPGFHSKISQEGLVEQPSEWVVIELQGDLNTRSEEPVLGKHIGDLHYSKDGTPILIIGHHILYGKVQNLEKPLILASKDKEVKDRTEYVVSAVIRKKLLFKTRPKPIIGNVPSR